VRQHTKRGLWLRVIAHDRTEALLAKNIQTVTECAKFASDSHRCVEMGEVDHYPGILTCRCSLRSDLELEQTVSERKDRVVRQLSDWLSK